MNGSAFAHCIHLLSAAENEFSIKALLKDAIFVENDEDAEDAFDAWERQEKKPEEESSLRKDPRGRKPLSHEKHLGPDLLTVVQQFVHGRGQMSQEGTRKKVSVHAFGATVPMLAKAVSQHFGRKVSETAIRRPFPPKRCDSKESPQKGFIDIRICRNVRGEKAPHERASWAAALVKMTRQFLTMSSSRGVLCREFSVDQLKKYPFWICATSGASPCGYMEVRGDGMPGFSVLDHDTPVGPNILLTVFGVEGLEVF